jgi:hypothetical protein
MVEVEVEVSGGCVDLGVWSVFGVSQPDIDSGTLLGNIEYTVVE